MDKPWHHRKAKKAPTPQPAKLNTSDYELERLLEEYLRDVYIDVLGLGTQAHTVLDDSILTAWLLKPLETQPRPLVLLPRVLLLPWALPWVRGQSLAQEPPRRALPAVLWLVFVEQVPPLPSPFPHCTDPPSASPGRQSPSHNRANQALESVLQTRPSHIGRVIMCQTSSLHLV